MICRLVVGLVVKCSVCGRRDAVYFRVFSGDKLCLPCLRRQLMRSVKRALGSAGVLKPRQRILVLVSPVSPVVSLAHLDLVSRIEAGYGSRIVAIVPDTIALSGDTFSRVEGIVDEVIRVDVGELNGLNLVECMRLDRGIAAVYARRSGSIAAILPYTRDHLTLAALEAITGEWWYWSESMDRWSGLVPLIAGFSRVESEAAAAYGFLAGYYAESRCSIFSKSKSVLKRVSYGRPELVYSSSKSIELFSRAVSRMGGVCRICGGFSDSSICSICRTHLRGIFEDL